MFGFAALDVSPSIQIRTHVGAAVTKLFARSEQLAQSLCVTVPAFTFCIHNESSGGFCVPTRDAFALDSSSRLEAMKALA